MSQTCATIFRFNGWVTILISGFFGFQTVGEYKYGYRLLLTPLIRRCCLELLSLDGVNIIHLPNALVISFLSSLIFSGIKIINLQPFCTLTNVRPIPAFPELGSAIIESLFSLSSFFDKNSFGVEWNILKTGLSVKGKSPHAVRLQRRQSRGHRVISRL
jgi:hypothetical protein